MSNTGTTSALACLEAVKELGLEKVATGCLAGLPLGVKPVVCKTNAAKKVITVDGCPFECAKKTVEQSGFKLFPKSTKMATTYSSGMKNLPLAISIAAMSFKGLEILPIAVGFAFQMLTAVTFYQLFRRTAVA